MQSPSEPDERYAANGPPARRAVLEDRIREKIADYDHYQFTVRQTRVLNIFFDLAQEYGDLAYLYHLPVELLQFFFNVKAELYARNEDGVFTVQTPRTSPEAALPSLELLSCESCFLCPESGWCFFPVKGRPDNAPTIWGGSAPSPEESLGPHGEEREILAVIAILPAMQLTEHDKLFYAKFANRLGFSLHNRILALKKLEHIEFVRTLVHDIGHNVIVPNLHFKLLMRQMEEKIGVLKRLSASVAIPGDDGGVSIQDLCCKLEAHYDEISKHFQQSSFFLETLLRQSHFDQGRYVLQRTRFALVPRVVSVQLERYRLRFHERGIALEERSFGGAGNVFVDGDIGLLSQVLANFFSNAVKYTRATAGAPERKARSSVTLEKGYFGPGLDGIKVAVCTTGAAIPEGEIGRLFSENFRASNADGEPGTGHGLYFSRLIVGQHGGECGYERDGEWNIFFMVLPVLRGNEGA